MALLTHRLPSESDIMVSEDAPLLGSAMAEPKLGGSNDALLGEGKKFTQYAGGLAACMASLTVGASMGWSSAAEDRITCADSADYDCISFTVSDDEFTWISALLSVGAMFGAAISGQIVDKVGRKRLLMILAPVSLLGWALITWAQALWMYYVGRLVTGYACGAYCVIAPMFTSEISEKSVRGALGAYFQMMMTVGIFIAYLLDYLVPKSFLTINIVCLITPIAMALCIFPLPDTPRFFLLSGNKYEARKSLVFYRGKEYDVDRELNEVEEVLNYEKELKIPFTTAIRSRAAKRGLLLSNLAMILQQFSGINAVIFYASSIFSDSGVPLNAKLCSVLMGICQTSATFTSTFLMDRAGRKVLLTFSTGMMAVASYVLAIYLLLSNDNLLGSVNISWLPILAVFVFIISFSLGSGPIPWLYMAEVFSTQVKGPGMAIATVVDWIGVFLVTKFFSDISNAIHMYGSFFLFGGISTVGVVLIMTLFIETKNKTLEQVQDELAGRKAPSVGGTAHS